MYKAGYNYVRMFCSYFMGERAHLLQYADVASEIVPICFMGVYRVSNFTLFIIFIPFYLYIQNLHNIYRLLKLKYGLRLFILIG